MSKAGLGSAFVFLFNRLGFILAAFQAKKKIALLPKNKIRFV